MAGSCIIIVVAVIVASLPATAALSLSAIRLSSKHPVRCHLVCCDQSAPQDEKAIEESAAPSVAPSPPLSAIQRMRLESEGDASRDAPGGSKLKAENILPSQAGLVNIAIFGVAAAAAAFAFQDSLFPPGSA